MQKIIQYFKDVRAEMGKVSWPTREELTSATTLVVVFSIVIAIVIKLFDVVLSRVLGFLLNM